MRKTLPDYIAEIGDQAAAVKFCVSRRTIASWRRRERFPRRSKAAHIIAAAGGELSFESIYSAESSATGQAA